MNTAEKLGQIIERRGIKLTAISSATNITVKALSKTFSNKRKLTADEFIAICKFVNVTMDEVRDFDPAA